MSAFKVLAVDDEAPAREAVREYLALHGQDCRLAENGEEALSLLRRESFDILITDLSMPGMSGLILLQEAKKLQPALVAMILSGTGTRQDIIQAMQLGAFDYLEKPLPDFHTFEIILNRAGRQCRLLQERQNLLRDLTNKNVKLETSLSQLLDAYAALRRHEETLQRDVAQAQRMQRKLLPHRLPELGRLELQGYFSPCERLGGDFFSAIPLGEDRMGLFLIDVMGHGVGAAMVTVILREFVLAHRVFYPDSDVFEYPDRALDFMNQRLLAEAFEPAMLATMVYAVVEPKRGRFFCASAGHPAPLLVRTGGQCESLDVQGPALGSETGNPYRVASTALGPGDLILFYSDGLVEAANLNKQPFGLDKLQKVLADCHGRSASEVERRIEDRLARFLSPLVPADDVSLIVCHCRATDVEEKKNSNVTIRQPTVMENHPPQSQGEVFSAWSGRDFALLFKGLINWQNAPTIKELLEKAKADGAENIWIELAECAGMDSTMLGLLYQNASRITLNRPGGAALKSIREMDLECVFHWTNMPLTFQDPPRFHPPTGGKDHKTASQMILSAHEALTRVSPANAQRFGGVVAALKQQALETDAEASS